MLIKNAIVFDPDKVFRNREINISGEKFVESSFINLGFSSDSDKKHEKRQIDATGLYAIPGLIDIHFHGCMGDDFCDAKDDTIKNIAKYEARSGITSICPATMTISKDELREVMRKAATYDNEEGAKLVGINMEGPFISEAKKGAQSSKYILKCDAKLFDELNDLSGNIIKLVDIAPENEGAMEFIKEVKDRVIVSIAHTMADYDTASKAFEEGASHVTHLYNAMPPFTHRAPGVIGAAVDNNTVCVELICDGIHIHPAVVRATFKMFGNERVILISDSMRACGLEDGEYTLGGQKVFVTGRKAVLEDGTIAGSVTNLFECMKRAVQDMHIRLEDAIAAATINPARQIGIFDKVGSIEDGKYADLVLMDKSLNIKAVYVHGKEIYSEL